MALDIDVIYDSSVPILKKMQRLILTFSTLHKVLAAEKVLRAVPEQFHCRVTPTPAGLGYSLCGMSIELLNSENIAEVIAFLEKHHVAPADFHQC